MDCQYRLQEGEILYDLAFAVFDWIRKNSTLPENRIAGYKFTSEKRI